ncbi:type II toxin-antitoxin system Phd/YefM family antitoxin [Streptomyces sp. NPDC007025]|uniref:type II toxin-antitoxin system Phd/YefM family antitoxin n=1 Tax=Streptomyces sp. NPDC007025 TaxID=3364771 RepID=UPI0036881A4C
MSSKKVGIEEARKTLGDLVNEVRYTGAVVTLTRHGKPVARITPVEDTTDTPQQPQKEDAS